MFLGALQNGGTQVQSARGLSDLRLTFMGGLSIGESEEQARAGEIGALVT